MTISQFLAWLVTAGGASAAFSFAAERMPGFQALSSSARSWVTLVCTLVIALVAFAVLTYCPADVLAQVAPWFQVVGAVFMSWLASQVAHGVDPATKK